MNKLLILVVIFLSGAWAYTSWYWYTCNIKGFCETTSSILSVSKNDEDALSSNLSSSFEYREENEEIYSESEDSLTSEEEMLLESERLSADDVLSASPIRTSS